MLFRSLFNTNTVTQISISLTTICKEPKGLLLYAAAVPAPAPTNPFVVVDNDKKDAMQVAFPMSQATDAIAAAASSSVLVPIVPMDDKPEKERVGKRRRGKTGIDRIVEGITDICGREKTEVVKQFLAPHPGREEITLEVIQAYDKYGMDIPDTQALHQMLTLYSPESDGELLEAIKMTAVAGGYTESGDKSL